ncbi:hypothetical protein DL98DRAFT_77540 [Cadophora sp. DSE1049]|nr:hypothetical protein DL98DRAFT_77540 [Cadophora sp. DSE1049]
MAPRMSSAQLYECTCVAGYIIEKCESCGGTPRDVAGCEPCAGTGSVRVLCPNHYDSDSAVSADATFASVTRAGGIDSITCNNEWETCPDCAAGRTSATCTTCGGMGVVANSSTICPQLGHSLACGVATVASIAGYGHSQSPVYLAH